MNKIEERIIQWSKILFGIYFVIWTLKVISILTIIANTLQVLINKNGHIFTA